jgi:hypothetical protein
MLPNPPPLYCPVYTDRVEFAGCRATCQTPKAIGKADCPSPAFNSLLELPLIPSWNGALFQTGIACYSFLELLVIPGWN